MKLRKQILLVPLMICCFTGCGAKTASDTMNPVESSLETETASPSETVQDMQPSTEEAVSAENSHNADIVPSEYEFSADLTHDGLDETIKVEVSKDKWDRPNVLLSVFDGEKVIFELEDVCHPVVASMYSLMDRKEGAYLMRYYALVDHGQAECEYEIFSLDSSGNKVELDSDRIVHELWHLDTFDKDKWIEFAEKENRYFKDSFLVYNALGDELECADTRNPRTYEENFSWMVTKGLWEWYSYRETTMKENLDLFIEENIDLYDNW